MGTIGSAGRWLLASAAVLALAACAPPGGVPALDAGTVALWPMDEPGGTTMGNVVGPTHDGVVGDAVAVGGGVYWFPGWTGNVDGSGRLTGSVDASAGAVQVADPADALDPRTGGVRVTLRLRAALTSAGQLPTAPVASFNIVQKGRADDPGGFWKLELAGSGAERGRLHWVLSDGRQLTEVTSASRVDDGEWHDVVAERRGTSVSITVDGRVATAARSVGDVHPVGRYAAAVTVGKKPGSTDPADAFAGWIDHLAIAS